VLRLAGDDRRLDIAHGAHALALSLGTMASDSGHSIVHDGGRSDGLVSFPAPFRTSIRWTPLTFAQRSPRPGVISRNGPPLPSGSGSPSNSYSNNPNSFACASVSVAAYCPSLEWNVT